MEGFKFKVKRRNLKHNSFNTTIDGNENLKKKKRGWRLRKRNLPGCMENVNVYGNNPKESFTFLKLEMPLFTRAEISPLAMNVTGVIHPAPLPAPPGCSDASSYKTRGGPPWVSPCMVPDWGNPKKVAAREPTRHI